MGLSLHASLSPHSLCALCPLILWSLWSHSVVSSGASLFLSVGPLTLSSHSVVSVVSLWRLSVVSLSSPSVVSLLSHSGLLIWRLTLASHSVFLWSLLHVVEMNLSPKVLSLFAVFLVLFFLVILTNPPPLPPQACP